MTTHTPRRLAYISGIDPIYPSQLPTTPYTMHPYTSPADILNRLFAPLELPNLEPGNGDGVSEKENEIKKKSWMEEDEENTLYWEKVRDERGVITCGGKYGVYYPPSSPPLSPSASESSDVDYDYDDSGLTPYLENEQQTQQQEDSQEQEKKMEPSPSIPTTSRQGLAEKIMAMVEWFELKRYNTYHHPLSYAFFRLLNTLFIYGSIGLFVVAYVILLLSVGDNGGKEVGMGSVGRERLVLVKADVVWGEMMQPLASMIRRGEDGP